MGSEGRGGYRQGTDRSAGRGVFFVLQVALGLSLLGVLLWTADTSRLWELVGSARRGWLLIALLWALSVHVSRAAMLCWLVRGRARISVARMFALNLISCFYSSFLPSQVGGDVVKGAYMWRRFPSGADAYAAIVVQRALGFAGTVVVGLIAAVVVAPVPGLIAACMTMCGVAGAMAIIARGGRADGTVPVESGRSEGRSRLAAALGEFRQAMASYATHRRRLGLAAGFSVLIAAQGVLVYYPLARATSSAMRIEEVFLAASLMLVSGALPLTPGGLGVGESAFVAAAAMVGAGQEDALAISVLARAVVIVLSLTGGVFHLFMPLSFPSQQVHGKAAGGSDRGSPDKR